MSNNILPSQKGHSDIHKDSALPKSSISSKIYVVSSPTLNKNIDFNQQNHTNKSKKTVTKEKQHEVIHIEPPSKILKITGNKNGGRETRWREKSQDDSESGFDTESYEAEPITINDTTVNTSLYSEVNCKSMTIEDNIKHLLHGIDLFCIYEKVNNVRQLLYTQSDIDFTYFSFFTAKQKSVGFLQEFQRYFEST